MAKPISSFLLKEVAIKRRIKGNTLGLGYWSALEALIIEKGRVRAMALIDSWKKEGKG